MAFHLKLTDDASFRSAFERNHQEAIREHAAATDKFLSDFWARQIIFWGRMTRNMEGMA